jgi:hypothetical protein
MTVSVALLLFSTVLSLLASRAVAQADFGVSSFTTATSATQAGGHPDVTTTFTFNSHPDPFGAEVPDGGVKDIILKLPPGLAADPHGAATCPRAVFGLLGTACDPSSQVGVANIGLPRLVEGAGVGLVFNISPSSGEPAALGIATQGADQSIDVAAGAADGYAISALAQDVATQPSGVLKVSVTLWGIPNSHTRGGLFGKPPMPADPRSQWKPFTITPTNCSQPQTTTLEVDSYGDPGHFLTYTSTLPPSTGCDKVPFNPSIAITPDTTRADAPVGDTVTLAVPQSSDPNGLVSSTLRKAVVTFPAGVSISPSAANGLQACTDAEFGAGSDTPASCPAGSLIGTTSVKSPLLDNPLTGYVYVGSPPAPPASPNPFRVFQEIKGYGLDIKLQGSVAADLNTGQLTAMFGNLPQLPFSSFTLKLNGGPGAPLANPQTCGPVTTTTALSPWSGQPDSTPFSSFNADWDGAGAPCPASPPFSPGFSAGTATPAAGAFSPFTLTFSRQDREQNLAGITVQTPPGLLGVLRSVTLCPEPQAAQGSCGPESLIGHTTVGAGPGPSPFFVPGNVFLTGPYNGAPFGLSVVVHAVAGPFDLGNVIVRASIAVDPTDAHLTVRSNPLPQILDGVPLRLRTIAVTVDRPGFMFNPTGCDPLAVNAAISSAQGSRVPVSSRFQVGGCAALPFAPSFKAATQAKASKANGASLDVKVGSGAGQANIKSVKVALPKQLPSRLTTLQKACLARVFEANPAACPRESVVGTATALTPVLAHPLAGPAYLISHGGAAFPDLEIVLQGEGITLILDGQTDITKGITTSTFNAVPDAPISSFELKLPTGQFSVLGAYVAGSNHYKLCGQNLTLPTTITGQNGVQIRESTHLTVTGCAAKPATRAQNLAKALKACRRKAKNRRAGCEAQARKQYGPSTKSQTARKAAHNRKRG